mmetsp:Transcript_14576/g.19927  ORF Transcript_14576/g.19927 Transcript_14576/m.19927 type:complete len:230 (-) Transcript_14576:168-857(-)
MEFAHVPAQPATKSEAGDRDKATLCPHHAVSLLTVWAIVKFVLVEPIINSLPQIPSTSGKCPLIIVNLELVQERSDDNDSIGQTTLAFIIVSTGEDCELCVVVTNDVDSARRILISCRDEQGIRSLGTAGHSNLWKNRTEWVRFRWRTNITASEAAGSRPNIRIGVRIKLVVGRFECCVSQRLNLRNVIICNFDSPVKNVFIFPIVSKHCTSIRAKGIMGTLKDFWGNL